jgi:opacity protein-like surface antigen
VKFSEGQVFRTSDDVDAYVLLDVFKISDTMTVGANLTNGHLGSNNDLYNLGVNFAMTGPFTLKVQADWQSGENKTATPSEKYQGYEFVAKGNVAADPVTINFLLGLGSGKKSTDTSTDIKQMVTVLDIDPHYTFLYEYKLATAAGATHTGLSNTTVASIGAAFNPSKSVMLGLDYYYLQATQKILNGQGDESSDVGMELDGKVYWKLYDNLSWNWDLGYFAPGKAMKTASGKSDAATGIQGLLALSF